MVSKRRDRIVVFRVTPEEHRQLQHACENSGQRNLSEFVRLELLHRVQSRKAIRVNMAGIEKRLADLEATYIEAMKIVQAAGQENRHAHDVS